MRAVTLPDRSGRLIEAAGDVDRLLPFAREVPVLGRIDECGDVEFDSSELASVIEELRGC